ncbi:MAG: TrmB family transcriptional regulator [Desulfobacteraceae bacterium]|jgi:sugar-specific transcriptional regulator TrmB|nr:TrmB family transcriptional regulator [Desulfobacteraceae bacterium]
MDVAAILRDFAFSKYESSCYLALLAHHPSNGSQLSKLSGIARSRIYDVLRGLVKKKVIFEIEKGLYVPLPFEELKKRLRSRFESNLAMLEEQLDSIIHQSSFEYLFTLNGKEEVIAKAVDIIQGARRELYLRLFPDTWKRLRKSIERAVQKGVSVRFISMGPVPSVYDIQVVHPGADKLMQKIGGESVDIISDRSEALAGIFAAGKVDHSPFIWTRNHWFVTANRDSLRHDFYHYFLDKLHERKEPLSARDRRIYAFIKEDD